MSKHVSVYILDISVATSRFDTIMCVCVCVYEVYAMRVSKCVIIYILDISVATGRFDTIMCACASVYEVYAMRVSKMRDHIHT